MRFFFLAAILGMLGVPRTLGQTAEETAQINVVPLPAVMQIGMGRLAISPAFSAGIEGYREPRLRRAMRRFLVELAKQTGEPIQLKLVDAGEATLIVHARHASQPVQGITEDESYTLDVSASGARIEAATPLGVLHGLQTFLQLVAIRPAGFAAPAIHIEDKPRFPWRGLMIDSCRHFMPVSVIERNLDAMEAVKLNVLHWHLSENQGFRIESRIFPKLQEMGSDGQYYTQAEVREVIGYARDRGIRVVPEFDMPGHATAWFAGYPQLASAPGPYEVERHFGIFDPAMDPTRESTYRFLDRFIGEMAGLFPDPVFHIGGDEVNGKQWDANPVIQAFRKAHGIESNAALQQYFTKRVEKLVRKHHKIMEGWDEILTPDLPADAIVQSWRGQNSLAGAALAGHRGLLSSGYYLNLMEPASQHYAVDPMGDGAATLTPEEAQLILGGEGCVWTEYISPENFDLRVWPRAAAIAERLWSPQTVKDVDSLYRRLDVLSARLDNDGLMIAAGETMMLERAAGTSDIAQLRVLAAVVEPVKGYARWQLAHEAGIELASADPLDRLMDSVPPESQTARQFSAAVNQLAAEHFHDAAAESAMRALLVTWKENDARLRALLRNSALLQDAAPLSADLAALGDAGLEALDYIDKGEKAPQAWVAQQLAVIDKSAAPRASLLIMVAPAVRKLVELSAGDNPQQ